MARKLACTSGLPRLLDDGHGQCHITCYEADRPARCEAKMVRRGKTGPQKRTSSTARRRTWTASHHLLLGRPSCPLRCENGKAGMNRPTQADFLDCSTTDMDSVTSLATRPTVLPAQKRKWHGGEKQAHTSGLRRLLDNCHGQLHITCYEADFSARCEAKMAWRGKTGPHKWTSSTARQRTWTASHHLLRCRKFCPLRSENGMAGKNRPTQADFLDCLITAMDSVTSLATRPTVLPAVKRKWHGGEKQAHTSGLPRLLDNGHGQRHITCYEADRPARCEAKMARRRKAGPHKWTSSTAR
jgi:hypothetical protein